MKKEEIQRETSECFDDAPLDEVSDSPTCSVITDEKEEEIPDFILRLIHDSWQGPNKKGEIYHLNKVGRKGKVDPSKEECPVHHDHLQEKRVTVRTKDGKSKTDIDNWRVNKDDKEDHVWTGLTVFFMKKEVFEKEGEEQKRDEYFEGRTILEFCCDEDSEIGNTSEEHQRKSLRCTHSMDTPTGRDEVISDLEGTREPVLVVSLPCTPWSKFQHLNLSKATKETRRKINIGRLQMYAFAYS